MVGPIDKICERCGERFQCGQYGCWCTDVPISEWQYDGIANCYTDCLCPQCLDHVARGGCLQAGPIGPPETA